jgi:type IV fimbrial biogenesis protein FimT
MMAAAAPWWSAWIRSSKIRAASDNLQNALRLAQGESLRRSRQVVFALTDDRPAPTATTVAAKDNGSNWAIFVLPAMAGADESASLVEAGIAVEVGSAVEIAGPAAICFNSVGRLVANASGTLKKVMSPGAATCSADTSRSYEISLGSDSDRRLRVYVAPGGRVHMCDPQKDFATSSDGCPAA